ncbi:hypothetical protein ACFLS4_05745, partial [Bacteroidota bacterium]
MKAVSIVFFLISICLLPFCLFSQNSINQGNFFIQNYNEKDYNTPENQTWAIVQDNNGIMYFGNNNGVLEFDGAKWNLYEIPNKSTVRSLAFDSLENVLYVGAVGELGYLEADNSGTLKYVSLVEKIPENYRNFEDVWQINVLNEQIIFRTTTHIFKLEKTRIKTYIPEDRFHTGFCVNNQFYVREWGKGLYKLENDNLIFIGQSGIFSNERIYAMLPYRNNKILIATRTQGIYIFSPNSEIQKFIKPRKFQTVNNFLIKNQAYCGINLDENKFIIGTLQEGLIIFDGDGKIIQLLNKRSGLINDHVLSINKDIHNNIWVGLNNGISYILFNSPFSFFNENNGLEGTIYTVKIYNNVLYVGTSQGLYVKDNYNTFSLIENTKGQSWNLVELNNDLLLTHSYGIFVIKENHAENILPNVGTAWNINEIKNSPYQIVGIKNGLFILEFTGKKWKPKHKVKGFNEYSRYLQIDNEN